MRTLLTRGGTLLAALTLIVAGAAPVAASTRNYVALSVGYEFSCAISERGDAYCWGANYYGQLGDGTYDQADVPTLVAGGLKFASISAGSYHTCGITTRGAAYCWGTNFDGVLGNNGSDNSTFLTPSRVAGGLKFASIAAGEYHTCGITTRGASYCWGDNYYGNLGNGQAPTDSYVPVVVSGGLRFKSISAGGYHSCGLTTRGKAYCWGADWDGQLGDDEELADKAVPVAVAGGQTFTALSLGYSHTAALTAGGAAYSWGDGYYGVHGNGDFSDHAVPVRAMGGARYTSIAGSDPESYTQCYGNRSGVLQCSGYNSDGMLPGDVSTNTPVTLAVSGAISYAAGDWHICALTTRGRATSGKIYCWGDNYYGNLGNDQSPTDSSVPVEVQ